MSQRRLAAVMVDLDHTLFDADAPRDRTARQALGRFVAAADVEGALAVYNQVVRQWRLFLELGYGNFRQVYDLPETLAITLALLDAGRGSTAATRRLWQDWSALDEGFAAGVAARLGEKGAVRPARAEQAEQGQARLLSRSALGRRFASALAGAVEAALESHDAARLQAAAASLNPSNFDVEPYADAVQFFETLANRYLLCVVTDGDDVTQWQKLQALGLDHYVGYDRLLSSWGAADAAGAATVLDSLAVLLARTSSCLLSEPTALELGLGGYAERQAHADAVDWGRVRDAVAFLRRWLARSRAKIGRVFYARALQAICVDPERPRLALEALRFADRAQWRAAGLQAAMVGDRFDTDVLPLTRQFGRSVLTVRVRRGKYGDTYPDPPPALAPAKTTDNLAEAAAWLSDEANWRGRAPITYPKVVGRADARKLADVLAVSADFPEGSVVRRIGDLLAASTDRPRRGSIGAARKPGSRP